jgi:hypothetical protein
MQRDAAGSRLLLLVSTLGCPLVLESYSPTIR